MNTKKATKTVAPPFYVVGIGASAGGLEAINQLLANVPENSGFAFVIIQHLSPDYKSLMGELLARHTHMKVLEADHLMPLAPDCVYVLPSKKALTVKSGKLQLHEKEKAAPPNLVIDMFFESLGMEYGPHAIGVILSGSGSDGTKGVKAIADKGGIVVVQDPSTAEFNSMPNSAISTGVVNLVLPPQSMGHEIMEYISDPQTKLSLRLNTQNDELLLQEILLQVKKATGQDFSYYKNPTLIRRLSKRMSELSIPNIRDYLEFLRQHSDEIKTIAHDFLINVTQFFRDREAFDIVRDEVIPAILRSKKEGDTVKVWVVAVSSGEEAYSLAILFHEQLLKKGMPDITVKIFATDVDKEALEIASRGIYPRSILDAVSGQRIAKYFDLEGENYKIKANIRKMVVFSHHDVIKDPPFGRLDLVSCRNMLIYINPETQKEILRKLHFAMNLNGYLFVGPSEHVDVIKSSLEEVDKKWRIYKCVSKARFEQQPFFNSFDKNSLVRSSMDTRAKNPLHNLGDLFKETLLEDDSYAGIFIDLNFDVKQAIGNYKNYIHFPEVQFNFNLLKLVPPDLAVALSTAVRKSIHENVPVHIKGIKLHTGKKTRVVHLHVKPYLHHNVYAQQFLFIVLQDEDQKSLRSFSLLPAGEVESARTEELERELRDTRENLQAMIEEMEATNEELQSANEEMVSANEELQSTNEELQSLNEELHTVSVEHQMKIKELMELNDDLNNYFRNSDIGQILVDKNFIIRKFSPSVTRMVNLIPSDIHRSLLDITTRFKGIDFIGNISQVIHSGTPLEKEVGVEDYTYLMRIAPYERHDKKNDGVVINFIDITHTRKFDKFLEAIFKSVPSGILAAKAVRNEKKEIVEFEFIAANLMAENNFGLSREDIVGKKIRDLFPGNAKETLKYYREVVETGRQSSYDFFNEHLNKWSNVVLVKFLDGVVSVSTDVTEKKKAADLVEKNYEELRKSLKLNKGKN